MMSLPVKNTRARAAVLFVALTGLLLSACGSTADDSGDGSGSEGSQFRILLPATTTGFADIIVAHGAGIFEEHGLDSEILPTVTNSAAQVQATASGEAEVTGTLLTTLFGAVDNGQSVVAVAAGPTVDNSVVVATSSWIAEQEKAGITVDSPPEEKVKALQGATMGLGARGTATEVLYRKLFDYYDVSYDDSTFVGLGDPSGLDAGLRSNQVDTIFTGLPTGLRPAQDEYGEIWLDSADFKEMPPWKSSTFGYITSEDWVTTHADDAERFLAAMKDARQLIAEDTEAAVEAYLKVAPENDPDLTFDSFKLIANNYAGDASISEETFDFVREVYDVTVDTPSGLSYSDGVWEGARK